MAVGLVAVNSGIARSATSCTLRMSAIKKEWVGLGSLYLKKRIAVSVVAGGHYGQRAIMIVRELQKFCQGRTCATTAG